MKNGFAPWFEIDSTPPMTHEVRDGLGTDMAKHPKSGKNIFTTACTAIIQATADWNAESPIRSGVILQTIKPLFRTNSSRAAAFAQAIACFEASKRRRR